MSFILAEDLALKTYLNDIYVSDDKNPNRKVGVWFGQPDLEVRAQSYPYITIDLIDVTEGLERAMRGDIHMNYRPSEEPASDTYFRSDYPIPYNLDYQITTYARQPRHDRQIMTTLMQNKFGHRYHTLYVPDDETERSMFLLGMAKRDTTEQDRRLFSNAFTVRVFAELLPSTVANVYTVDSRNITYENSPEPFETTIS